MLALVVLALSLLLPQPVAALTVTDATGRRIEFGRAIDREQADAIVRRVVANPVIERWSFGPIDPVFHAGGAGSGHSQRRRHSSGHSPRTCGPIASWRLKYWCP